MKKYIFIVFLFSGLASIFGQETEDVLSDEDEIIDNLLGEESVEDFLKSATQFHFINVSVDYNNKTYFSGRDNGTDQFNVSPQLTYINSNGFFTGITGVYFSEFDPKWDYTAITLGYGKSFGKNNMFRWSTSYARYFFSDSTEDNPLTNAVSLGFDIDNIKRTLGADLTSTYLFGSENSFQLVFSTYGSLNLFKTNKYHLRLRPQLNIVWAEQTIQLNQAFSTTVSARRPPIPPPPPPTNLESNSFGLINTQFQIPLQFDVKEFTFELGYIINFPSELEGETNLETTSNFNFSISYLIDL